MYARGDVTITINFYADCSDTELVYFCVRMWSGSPEKAHTVELYLGNPAGQLYQLRELSTSYEVRAVSGPDIPGYSGTGDYKLRIEKKGNVYSAYLGTRLLGTYAAEDYFADWFYISLEGRFLAATSMDSIYIRDMRVRYDEGEF